MPSKSRRTSASTRAAAVGIGRAQPPPLERDAGHAGQRCRHEAGHQQPAPADRAADPGRAAVRGARSERAEPLVKQDTAR